MQQQQQHQGQRMSQGQPVMTFINHQGQLFHTIPHFIPGIDTTINNVFSSGPQILPGNMSLASHMPPQMQSAQQQLITVSNAHQLTQIDPAKIPHLTGIPASIPNQSALTATVIDPSAMNPLQHANGTNPSLDATYTAQTLIAANHASVAHPNQIAAYPYQLAAGAGVGAPPTGSILSGLTLNQHLVALQQAAQPPPLLPTANALPPNGALVAVTMPMPVTATNGTPAPIDSLVDSQQLEQLRSASATPQTAAHSLPVLVGGVSRLTSESSSTATGTTDSRNANSSRGTNIEATEFVPRAPPAAPRHKVYTHEGKPAPQNLFNPLVTFKSDTVNPVDPQPPSTPPKQPQKRERTALPIIDPKSSQPVDLSNVNVVAPAKPSVPEEGTNPANQGVIIITNPSDKLPQSASRSRSSSIATSVSQQLPPSESAATPLPPSATGERSRTASLSRDAAGLTIVPVEQSLAGGEAQSQASAASTTLAPACIDPVANSLSTTSASSGIEQSASIVSSSPSLAPQLSESDATRVSTPASSTLYEYMYSVLFSFKI